MTAGVLHVVVPRGIDDPLRPSGGNTYDRRLCEGLRKRGWRVHVVEVEGGWPWSADVGAADLGRALRRLPDSATAIVDGLLASWLPSVVVPASRRLRVVLLVHLPVGVDHERARTVERRVVAAAAAVVVPSAWCRDWLADHYGLDPARVVVARPGVDPAPPTVGSSAGTRLLTVGSLAPVKGQDRLLDALGEVRHLSWRWTCVGPTSVVPGFVERLRAEAAGLGVVDRVALPGPMAGDDLAAAYADSDLVVVPSRAETYGMVVTEALARGVPVLAADVGGVREALGETRDGQRPGLLVPTRRAGLASGLRWWLSDEDLRERLRGAAAQRRADLTGWSVTAGLVADALGEPAA